MKGTACVRAVSVAATFVVAWLVGAGCSRRGEQNAAWSGGSDLQQKLVGKWVGTSGHYEFFPGGDFSYQGPRGFTAGSYKLINSKHVKLQAERLAVIYEIESFTETEIRLRGGGQAEVWLRPTPGIDYGSGIPGNEASAVGALRTINTACVTYASTYGGFPPTLASLGPGKVPGQSSAQSADLIDSPLAAGQKAGYSFTYRAGSPDATGKITTYELRASPVKRGVTGERHFFSDQTGVIRANRERPATAGDRPI